MLKKFDELIKKIQYETNGIVSTTYEPPNKWYDALYLNEGLIRTHNKYSYEI